MKDDRPCICALEEMESEGKQDKRADILTSRSFRNLGHVNYTSSLRVTKLVSWG